MSDSAKGPLSGYLFQFERALFLLSGLSNSTDYITIEGVEDVATHSNDGTILIADQSKHSISRSGTTFGDTSQALWRTLELWISKVKNNVFNEGTQFICSTNKDITTDSLIYFICNNEFTSVKEKIKELRNTQKEKLKKYKETNPSKGETIKRILKLINYVLKEEEVFRKICSSIKIEDNINLKEATYNRLHINSSRFSELQKEKIYESLIGWLVNNSLYKWKNSESASFKKIELDNKYQDIISSPSIVKAIFRAKDSFGDIDKSQIDERKGNLFVKQIDIISRRKGAKKRIIEKAIKDFIRYEIELEYIITELGDFTKDDFKKFIDHCREEWQSYFDSEVIYELDEYNDDEKNKLAIRIYDYIMNDLNIKFNNDYKFNSDNIYIKNGSFLKLSNIPEIGWHPDWEQKFKEK